MNSSWNNIMSIIIRRYAKQLFGTPPHAKKGSKKLQGGSPPSIKDIEKIITFFKGV